MTFHLTSRFGFEGWSWVLIASVLDLCILNQDQCSTTDSLNSVTNALNQATAKALPIKTTKLQGLKIKLSPQVKTLDERYVKTANSNGNMLKI